MHREKQAAKLERRAGLAAGGGLPRGRPPLVQPERPEREDARLPGAEVPPPPWLPAGSGLLPPALLASALPPLFSRVLWLMGRAERASRP